MSKFIEKVGAVLFNIFCFFVLIGFLWLIGSVTIYFGKSIWYDLTKPKPVCHWEYKDTDNNARTANICKLSWGQLYCGNNDDINVAISAERVCE